MALSFHRIAERNCSGRAKTVEASKKAINQLICNNKKYLMTALAFRHPSALRSIQIAIYNFG
jgi:hypothetical protein